LNNRNTQLINAHNSGSKKQVDMKLHLMQIGVDLSAQKSVYFDGDFEWYFSWVSPLLPKTKKQPS